ncbi:hypothetical protein U1Q18_034601 [Sarracenia purpurea var. burkii]
MLDLLGAIIEGFSDEIQEFIHLEQFDPQMRMNNQGSIWCKKNNCLEEETHKYQWHIISLPEMLKDSKRPFISVSISNFLEKKPLSRETRQTPSSFISPFAPLISEIEKETQGDEAAFATTDVVALLLVPVASVAGRMHFHKIKYYSVSLCSKSSGGGGVESIEHKRCSCGEHCGCNPCPCSSKSEITASGGGRAICKCGAGCTCLTCAA